MGSRPRKEKRNVLSGKSIMWHERVNEIPPQKLYGFGSISFI